MEQTTIKTQADLQAWIQARQRYDIDFEGDYPSFPFLIIWSDGEANGRPYVNYTTYTLRELENLFDNLAT